MSQTQDRKIKTAYSNLTAEERVRMMAKLARDGKTAELNRLRDATPPAQAKTYNKALALLNGINGVASFWVGLFALTMERDRHRLNHAILFDIGRSAHLSRAHPLLDLTGYPVTESELARLETIEGQYLLMLEDFARVSLESGWEDTARINPLLAAFDVEEGVEQTEEEEAADIAAFVAMLEEAIKRGELPKPKRLEGKPALPAKVLNRWAFGEPEERPGFLPFEVIPAIALLFDAGGRFDVHPDSEAEEVAKRRASIAHLLTLGAMYPPGLHERIAALFEPPQDFKAWEVATKEAEEMRTLNVLGSDRNTAEVFLEAMRSHAQARAELRAWIGAVERIAERDFGGESPINKLTQEAINVAIAEEARIEDVWRMALRDTQRLKHNILDLLGIPFTIEARFHDVEAIPLPEEPVDVDGMEARIRAWSA